MRRTRDLSILIILTICLCLILEYLTYFLNLVFFLVYSIILLIIVPRLSIGKQTLIRNILIFVLGAWFVIWLNEIISPDFVLVFGFPFLFPQMFWRSIASWYVILLALVPSFCLLVIFAYFLKGFKGTLFFIGGSLASILYAGWGLIQIAWLYYTNVGWALPDINIEGYSFPAIYIFKLFRSIFLAASFTLLGYLSNIGILSKIVDKFRRKKEKRLTDFESHSEEASVKEVLNLHKDKGQIEGSKMSEKKKLLTNEKASFVYGVLLGIFLNFALEPLLHYLIFKDFVSELAVFLVFIAALVVFVPLLLEKPFLGTETKKAYRMLSLGISLSSFLLALITFFRYPSIIASTSYGWLVQVNWIIGGVSMGSIVFFIASILWDTLIGSAFAVLERLLT